MFQMLLVIHVLYWTGNRYNSLNSSGDLFALVLIKYSYSVSYCVVKEVDFHIYSVYTRKIIVCISYPCGEWLFLHLCTS